MNNTNQQGLKSRRELLLQAGAWGKLSALGLALGAVSCGLKRRTAQAADSRVRSGGVVDPEVGSFGRRAVDPYLGKQPGSSGAGSSREAIPTACLQCVAICGIVGHVEDGRLAKISGNPHSPNNRGMVCAKGQAGLGQMYDPDRLLHPLVRTGKRGEGKWRRIKMAEALDLVAFGGEINGHKVTGLKQIYESEHPEEFMFHYGRSRIKGAVNHFCKDGMGTKTIGNHTSICETGKWLGQELSVGKHYDINDAAHSRYILIMGANVLEAHTSHSYFAQRVTEGRQRGAKMVTFDVRLSNTAAASDEWVPIRPGTDLAVVLAFTRYALLEQPYGRPLYDAEFIRRWTNVTLEELKAHYEPYSLSWAAEQTGVPVETLERVAREYTTTRPATLVTYRGYVGHYNGAYAEFAAKALEGICGNLMVKGGTQMKVSGKWEDAYAAVNKAHPEAVRHARGLKLLDGKNVHMPTHHVSQKIFERIASGEAGRPKLYMTYTWNGAYTCGDNQRTRETLADEQILPFIVAVDTSMSETTELADLILPDACYLERYTAEAPQSYNLTSFLQLRQPVVPPPGECLDIQDIFIQLARRIGGGISDLHPFDSGEEYVRKCLEQTAAKAQAAGKPLLGVTGEPVSEQAWSYLKRHGFLHQSTEPVYHAHEQQVSEKDLAGTLVDAETGVVWNPGKAKVSESDAQAKGYRGSKSAYKGYLGQLVEGVVYKGFKPDKFNKSGLVEIRSSFLAQGAGLVWNDIESVVRPDESFLKSHLESGLPCWVPVPEHRLMRADQLILVSYKVNVQIHSRSQNCKWLQEISHNNPLMLNSKTARRLLGDDVRDGDLVRITQSMPELQTADTSHETVTRSITARLRLSEAVQPDSCVMSFHCGHWAYGRYASGKALDPAVTGGTGNTGDHEKIWWQQPADLARLGDATQWNELRGVHTNWIIPNSPARVSGQYRSNDTLVTLSRV